MKVVSCLVVRLGVVWRRAVARELLREQAGVARPVCQALYANVHESGR